ncbi:MAG: histidine phosphatase family protein, partial [Chloroflexota bacterium]|nr:histidine phosphatase family protein [Chloroflexota bacterium]
LVLCSPARRARETLERLGLSGAETHVEDELYGAEREDLLARLHEVPEATISAAVIGHNPGMHDLAIELAGSGLDEQAERVREKFPTGAVAVFAFDGPWRDLERGRATLTSFVVPREIG